MFCARSSAPFPLVLFKKNKPDSFLATFLFLLIGLASFVSSFCFNLVLFTPEILLAIDRPARDEVCNVLILMTLGRHFPLHKYVFCHNNKKKLTRKKKTNKHLADLSRKSETFSAAVLAAPTCSGN